jgi:hypothetical protein
MALFAATAAFIAGTTALIAAVPATVARQLDVTPATTATNAVSSLTFESTAASIACQLFVSAVAAA